MKETSVNQEVIKSRLEIIQKSLRRLEGLREFSPGRFALPDNLDIAENNLRHALEATFDICGHLLTRIPGAQVGEYKQMAREMGRLGIVPQEFAAKQLYQMAGYRNRLTHFYFEVTPYEMYEITRNNIGDFEIFMKAVKQYLERDHKKKRMRR